MPLQKINLREKLASFEETWVPKIVGELNGQYVKVVKIQGEYVWPVWPRSLIAVRLWRTPNVLG